MEAMHGPQNSSCLAQFQGFLSLSFYLTTIYVFYGTQRVPANIDKDFVLGCWNIVQLITVVVASKISNTMDGIKETSGVSISTRTGWTRIKRVNFL